ncbi:DNA mismatch repair protein MutS [bacterium]|nr:DNA mismatch repair protein MutS [bacterium]
MYDQYLRVKATCGDALLFFRIGDFYETFGEDAVIASRVCDIALTKKYIGRNMTVPLAGVPYHAVQGYLQRLTRAGHKVAICEQMTEPQKGRAIVEREVVRTVTPGTLLEAEALEARRDNYLCAIEAGQWDGLGLAYADISTGEFRAAAWRGERALERLWSELGKLMPAEVLLPEGAAAPKSLEEDLRRRLECTITRRPVAHFDGLLPNVTQSLPPEKESEAPELLRMARAAASALLKYVEETQKNLPAHLAELVYYTTAESMALDPATERNLELVRNLRDAGRTNTLLSVLDRTRTPMGARLLRHWILRPLLYPRDTIRRRDAVGLRLDRMMVRQRVAELLEEMGDLERLVGRVCFGNANARDLVSIGRSLARLPTLNAILSSHPPLCRAVADDDATTGEPLAPETELADLLDRALVDEPPLSVREGGLFREGYHDELDELRSIRRDGHGILAEMQERERRRTGIPSLKVSYNKVFGYYIEITHAHRDKAPPEYVRKQTLVNTERFITPELKDYENKVLGAQERIESLEYALFRELLEKTAARATAIKETAARLARLDALVSLADVAEEHNYCRPDIDESGAIEIDDGRHPVLEQSPAVDVFVPNGVRLDNRQQQLMLITGPNMAGKSTFIRQVALIVLMAQIGSYVPAKRARIGVVDRIFTRVGASDNLAGGQSTFMVEMSEAAHILAEATPRSLVVLDEIGRGTSTFDGVSLAWAIAEYLHERGGVGVKTLFATHYHELAELEERLLRVVNYRVLVVEEGRDVRFLYRVEKGHSDHSYGIAVAKLAGVPESVISRARTVLQRLEAGDHLVDSRRPASVQMSLFSLVEEPLARRLRELDVEALSPLEALQLLSRWKAEMGGEA